MMDTITQPRDVVAVFINEELSFYARVEDILPDVKRGWKKFRFLVLSAPLHEMTWILEPRQIDGETFTMGGTPIRIDRIPDPAPVEPEPETEPAPKEKPPAGDEKAKIITFPTKGKS